MVEVKVESGIVSNDQDRNTNVPFDFVEEDRGDYIVLCPKGGICNSTIKFMKNRLYDLSCENGCRIVMSMKDVDFIDSVGLGTIITAHKNCVKCGGQIVFCSMSPMISKNMKMLHMDKLLNIVPDLITAEEVLD